MQAQGGLELRLGRLGAGLERDAGGHVLDERVEGLVLALYLSARGKLESDATPQARGLRGAWRLTLRGTLS